VEAVLQSVAVECQAQAREEKKEAGEGSRVLVGGGGPGRNPLLPCMISGLQGRRKCPE
jgi:hypothetical protein